MTRLVARVRVERSGFILDASLDVPAVGVTGIFGPSGAGKTTLLRCIAGLEPRGRGEIELGADRWQHDAARVFVPPHRRGVGYVFQEADLFPHLSVRRNLQFGHRRSGGARQSVPIEEIVEWLSLGRLLDRAPTDLSGGERQRVAIGRALAAGPRILLMDEPLAALDQPARAEILPYLRGLPERLAIPIVYVSHSLAEITRLSDRLVWLVDGRIRAAGRPATVLAALDFSRLSADEMAVTIEARVRRHDSQYALTELDGPWGAITVQRVSADVGQRVRVQIRAGDVSLGRAPQTDTSILNEFAVEIADIRSLGDADVLICLAGGEGGADLLARLTRKSVERLDLRVGGRVYARVKTLALVN
jgi:molybdate transport system ATP-binding protein